MKSYIIYFIDDQCFKTSGPGPHPTSCLIAWWLEAGCSINGQKSPIVNNNIYWNRKKVATVKMDMSLYVQNALTSNVYRLLCYGVWYLAYILIYCINIYRHAKISISFYVNLWQLLLCSSVYKHRIQIFQHLYSYVLVNIAFFIKT